MNGFNSNRTFVNQSKNYGIRQILLASASTALLLLAAVKPAVALPQGGTVVGGAATFAVDATNTKTTITQTSDRAAIDWTSFDLDTNETAEFKVPAATSATLNRITGPGVTTIKGTVTSNGNVYFVNPNGLVFDASSRVTANGFIASVNDITNANFISGKAYAPSFSFSSVNNSLIFTTTAAGINSTVSLKGDIKVNDFGLVAAIGPNVENSGTITADFSTVGLISATKVYVIDYRNTVNDDRRFAVFSDNHDSFQKTGSTIRTVKNSGTITSDGGKIFLTTGYVNQSNRNSSVTVVNSGSLFARGKVIETINSRKAVVTKFYGGNISVNGYGNGADFTFSETSIIEVTGVDSSILIGNKGYDVGYNTTRSVTIKNGSVITGPVIRINATSLTIDGQVNAKRSINFNGYYEGGAIVLTAKQWDVDFTKLNFSGNIPTNNVGGFTKGALTISIASDGLISTNNRSFGDRLVMNDNGPNAKSSLTIGDVKYLLGLGDLHLSLYSSESDTVVLANTANSQLSWNSGNILTITSLQNLRITGGNNGINSHGADLNLYVSKAININSTILVGTGALTINAAGGVTNNGSYLQANSLNLYLLTGNSIITNAEVSNLYLGTAPFGEASLTFVNQKSLTVGPSNPAYLNTWTSTEQFGNLTIVTAGDASYDLNITQALSFIGSAVFKSSGKINILGAISGAAAISFGDRVIGSGDLSILADGDINIFTPISIGSFYKSSNLKIVSDFGSISIEPGFIALDNLGRSHFLRSGYRWDNQQIRVNGNIEIIASNINTYGDIFASGDVSIIGNCGGSATALCYSKNNSININGIISTKVMGLFNYWWNIGNSGNNGNISIANYGGGVTLGNLVSAAGTLSIFATGSIVQVGGRIESQGKGITVTSTSTDGEVTVDLSDVQNVSSEDGSDQPGIVINSAKGIRLSGNALRLVTLPPGLVALNSAINKVELVMPETKAEASVEAPTDSTEQVAVPESPITEAPVSIFQSVPVAAPAIPDDDDIQFSPVAFRQ